MSPISMSPFVLGLKAIADIHWMYKIFDIVIQVRMAERSKAPDSSIACTDSVYECSGLHLEAWVRIPLLTRFFHLCFNIVY